MLQKEIRKRFSSVALMVGVFVVFGFSLFISNFDTFAQESIYQQAVIVGEVIGRVNPEKIMLRIRKGYYPVISDHSEVKIELVSKSPGEVIYHLIYPSGSSDSHPQYVVFRFFDSEHSLAAAIITDEIDFAISESFDIAEEIHKSTSAYYIRHRFKQPNFVKMLAYNNKNPILQNENLRKALTYSIDKEYIYDNILEKQAYYADGPISNQSKHHASGLKTYKFNPKFAIELILTENWRDVNNDGILDKNRQPFRLSLAYEKGVHLDEQIARVIQIGWNKLGINVNRNPLTKAQIEQKLAHRNYDVILLNYHFDDTYETFKKYFESTSPDNFLGYHGATTDKYLRLYKTVPPESRDVMFQAIQNQINKDHLAAFLYFMWIERYFVNRVKFTNYRSDRTNLLPFTDWIFR